MIFRKVQPEDAKGICEIYNYYIEHTCITFETVPVTEEEMRDRIKDIVGHGFLYYVAELEDKIVGYAYLNSWKARQAYSHTQEVTIYLHPEYTGKGYGTRLYGHLFKHMDKKHIHTLIAGICIPNEGSVKLHESFGFCQVSHMKETGYKFGKWLDVGHWQMMVEQ